MNNIFAGQRNALVALSGGVDSAVLLALAKDAGLTVHAATVVSEFTPSPEESAAREFAERLGVPWHAVRISLLAEPELCKNPPERCYLCKKIIMGQLKRLAAELGLDAVFDGTHADDLSGADRPGIAALKELGIFSPLAAAGIGKEEILKIAREKNIPAPPASACLATRIPFGEELTAEKLRLVDTAEQALRAAGVKGVLRVRLTEGGARVEVGPGMLKSAELYEQKLKQVGLADIAFCEYHTGGGIWKKKMQ